MSLRRLVSSWWITAGAGARARERARQPISVAVRNAHARNDKQHQQVMVFDEFKRVEKQLKNKQTYLDMIGVFESRDRLRRGHVEFIYAALRHMSEFGVSRDLQVYKRLLQVLPAGRFVATNMFQAEFMHYPKQQQCAIDLLETMEDNGVMPDSETEIILLNIFGKRGYPLRKYWRMMYWMPKFKNLSPWRLPQLMPTDALDLAKLAIQRITSVDNDMKISVFYTDEIEAALDDTWIVSAQCPSQISLLAMELNRTRETKTEPLEVRGRYTVRLNDQTVTYFTLTAPYQCRKENTNKDDDVSNIVFPDVIGDPSLPALLPTVHEQDDGVILAVCATGTSSRDSLLSWIRLLEKHGNPSLASLPVIFTLTAPPSEVLVPETVAAH